MKKSLKLISIALFAMACNGGSQKELDKLESEVMAVHDEVMPKMGDIMTLKSELTDNLKKIDSTSVNYAKAKAETDSLNNLLTEADNGMMDWMDEYNADTLKVLKAEEATKYLLEQKAKLNSIKESTNMNIEAVKSYLKK